MTFRKLLLSALLPLALLATTPVVAADVATPTAVVRSAVDGVIGVLKARADKKSLSEQDRAAIRQAVAGRFDFAEMAKRTLGTGWKSINDKERASFAAVFQDLLERSYGNRLAEYSNQLVDYKGETITEDRAKVDTDIVDSDKRIPVEYSLYQSPKGWLVYDIRIEEVSLVSTYRESFKSVLKKDGFKGLMKTLDSKLAGLKKSGKKQLTIKN